MSTANHRLLGGARHITELSEMDSSVLQAGLIGRDLARSLSNNASLLEVGDRIPTELAKDALDSASNPVGANATMTVTSSEESKFLFIAECERRFEIYQATNEYKDIEQTLNSSEHPKNAWHNFNQSLSDVFERVLEREFELSKMNIFERTIPENDSQQAFGL